MIWARVTAPDSPGDDVHKTVHTQAVPTELSLDRLVSSTQRALLIETRSDLWTSLWTSQEILKSLPVAARTVKAREAEGTTSGLRALTVWTVRRTQWMWLAGTGRPGCASVFGFKSGGSAG